MFFHTDHLYFRSRFLEIMTKKECKDGQCKVDVPDLSVDNDSEKKQDKKDYNDANKALEKAKSDLEAIKKKLPADFKKTIDEIVNSVKAKKKPDGTLMLFTTIGKSLM